MRDFALDFVVQRDEATQTPILQARDVRFSACGKHLLDLEDLTITAGRRNVILGANGAGKSLTLRLLHGLIAPSAGQVLWKGATPTRKDRKSQAMVFQRPVMLRRTVRANFRFVLGLHGFSTRERRAREERALEMARLEDLANRPARVLSGGEQQRLAIARALSADPEVLFLDEPTANLDPASTAMVEGMIQEAWRAGVTIVLVTHDLGQARRLADDVVFLHQGRVAEAGAADHVLSAPRSGPAQAWMDGRLFVDPN